MYLKEEYEWLNEDREELEVVGQSYPQYRQQEEVMTDRDQLEGDTPVFSRSRSLSLYLYLYLCVCMCVCLCLSLSISLYLSLSLSISFMR